MQNPVKAILNFFYWEFSYERDGKKSELTYTAPSILPKFFYFFDI